MIYLFDWGDTLMKDDPSAKGPMFLWDKVALCPWALPMLETLSRDHDLYLATNAEDSDEGDIRRALDRVGIGIYIKGIFCYRRLCVKKPSVEFFDAILSELRCTPAELVMVGDDPVKDVLWAVENGARGILYDPSDKHDKCGCERIRSLMELCP